MSRKLSKKAEFFQGIEPNTLAVRFWGVRGTLPSPGADFIEFGGHTSCVEVMSSAEGSGDAYTSLVLDAGTGIVGYGESALARGQDEFHILLSHYHYDHIIGLTRFAPLFRPNVAIHFYGHAKGGLDLPDIIERIFSFPFFPLEYRNLPSKNNLHFHTVVPGSPFSVGPMIVIAHELHHPQQAFAYRVWDNDLQSSLVYATDHEHGTDSDLSLAAFSRNADLFLFDTTYTSDVYDSGRQGWGHSTARRGAEIAEMAQVKQFGLFHHDPDSTDAMLKSSLLVEGQKYFPASFLCKEGQTVTLKAEDALGELLLASGSDTQGRRPQQNRRRKHNG